MTIATYKFALSTGGDLVCIDSMHKQDQSSEYFCVSESCGKPMIPVMGDVRIWHFRHKVESDCPGETYLHSLAKRLFCETYKECLESGEPFFVQYQSKASCNNCNESGPCDVGHIVRNYDLTQLFKDIQVEKQDDTVRPDILLSAGGKQLYIEIAVTHFCEPGKIELGKPIIELAIESEADLNVIQSKKLPRSDHRVRYYNFNSNKAIGTGKFVERCNKRKAFFILHSSGKCIITTDYQWKFEELQHSYYVKAAKDHSSEVFVQCVVDAFKAGHKITNCWLCRKHSIGYATGDSYCITGKKTIMNTSDAHKCLSYTMLDINDCTDLLQRKISACESGRVRRERGIRTRIR